MEELIEQPKKKALVLLGYRNSGKDAIANALQARFNNITNVKFGRYNKLIIAQALNVPVSYLKDKDYRTSTNVYKSIGFFDSDSVELFPIDLVNVLFYGLTNTEAQHTEAVQHLTNAYMEHALSEAKTSQLPVFTDIRREQELDVVQANFDAFIVWVDREQQPREGDEELTLLKSKAHYVLHNLFSLKDTLDSLINELRSIN